MADAGPRISQGRIARRRAMREIVHEFHQRRDLRLGTATAGNDGGQNGIGGTDRPELGPRDVQLCLQAWRYFATFAKKRAQLHRRYFEGAVRWHRQRLLHKIFHLWRERAQIQQVQVPSINSTVISHTRLSIENPGTLEVIAPNFHKYRLKRNTMDLWRQRYNTNTAALDWQAQSRHCHLQALFELWRRRTYNVFETKAQHRALERQADQYRKGRAYFKLCDRYSAHLCVVAYRKQRMVRLKHQAFRRWQAQLLTRLHQDKELQRKAEQFQDWQADQIKRRLWQTVRLPAMAKLADSIYQSNLLIRIIHRWSALARAEIYQSDTARALADRNRRTVARRLFCQWMRVVDDYNALERMAEKHNREHLLHLTFAWWRERFRPVQNLDAKAGAYATRLTLIRAFSAWNTHTYRAAQSRVHERLLNIFQGRHDWRVKQHVVRALKLRLHRQKMVGRSGTRFSAAREKNVQRTVYYTWRRRIRHQARLQAHAAGIHHSRVIQHVWATWLLKFGESVADSDLAENFAAAQLEDSTRDVLSGWCQVTLTLALQEREVRVLLEIGLKRQVWKVWSASLCSPVKQRREATAERWNQLRLTHQAWRHWWRHTQASRFLAVRHERQARTILSHWRQQNQHLGRVKAQYVVYEVAARYRALRRVWQRWHDRHRRLQEAAQKMAQRSRTMRLVTFFAQWITSGMDREGLAQDALTHARGRLLRRAWDRLKSQSQAQYQRGEDLDVRARQADGQRILRYYLSRWKKVPVELKPAVAFIQTNWQRRLIRKAWDHWQRRLHLVNGLNKLNDRLAQQQHAVLTRQAYQRWWAMTVARLEQMQSVYSEAHQIVAQKTLRQCLYYWKSLPTDLARRAASVRYTRQQDLKRRAWRCCVTKMTHVYEMAYDGDKLVAQRQLATLRKVWSAWQSRVTPSGRVAAPTPLAHRLRRLRALANVFSKRQAWRLMNRAVESMRERRSNHARLVEAHVPRALVARVPYPCYTALAHYHLVRRTWANWRALAGQRQAWAQQIDATLRQYQLTRRAPLWHAWQTRATAAGLARREQRCERQRVEFARRSAQRSRQASWKVWKGQVTTLRRGHRLRGQAEEHARRQLLRTALQTWRSRVQRRQHHERLKQLQRRLAEYARQRRARATFLALAYGGLHRRPVLLRFFVRLERRRIEAILAGRWGGVPRIPPLPAAFGRNSDSVVELMDHYESRLATVADEVYRRSLLRPRLENWKASSWRLEAKHRGMDRLAETWAAQLTKRHAKRTWLSRMSALRLNVPS